MNSCSCCEANIFNEEETAEPMASARINGIFFPSQSFQPIHPNPSFVIFPGITQGLYDYNDNLGNWTITDPTTITINKTGNYGIGLLMNIFNGVGPGTVICQVENLAIGAIGTVPPILSTQNTLVISPNIEPGFYVGVASGYANAHLVAGSTIKVAYLTDVGCDMSPTSALSITLLEGTPGPQGLPGPSAPSVNIYNSDGAITDVQRTVSMPANWLNFDAFGSPTSRFSVNGQIGGINNRGILMASDIYGFSGLSGVGLWHTITGDINDNTIAKETYNIACNDWLGEGEEQAYFGYSLTGPFPNPPPAVLNRLQAYSNRIVMSSQITPGTLERITLDAPNAQTLIQSNNIVLVNPLPNDDLQTQLVVRDPGTGSLLYRDAASFSSVNIYNTDGTLTGPRQLTMGPFGNDLSFEMNNNKFIVKSAATSITIDGLNSTLVANLTNSATITSPNITLGNTVPNDDTQTQILVRNSGTGRLQYRLASTLANSGIGMSVQLTGLQTMNPPYYILFDRITTSGCYVSGITYVPATGVITILSSGIYVFQAQAYIDGIGNSTFGLLSITSGGFYRACEVANPNVIKVYTLGCTLQLTAGEQLAVYSNTLTTVGAAAGNATLDTYFSIHQI